MNERRIRFPKTILFVCTGNTCRSVMAQGLFHKMLKDRGKKDIKLASAGTGALPGMKPPREVEDVLGEEGIDVSQHEATRLTTDLIEKADLILAMDRCHQQTILEMSSRASEKTFLLEEFISCAGDEFPGIPDPIGESLDTYREIFGKIKRCLEELLKKVDWYLSALTGRDYHG
ncbi:MAG: low molecular weight protein arginine phosphatase [Nitrospirae bacterium]|nr:low molecular weight protein arginine phosphatase [Nitrospirota bacterium]